MNGIQENLMSESAQNAIVPIGTKPRKVKAAHRCAYCKQDKPREEFYKYRYEHGLRLNSRCKACGSAYTTELIQKRDYNKKEYSKRDPFKQHVRDITKKAIKEGIITIKPCEVCGEKAQTHHPDYSQPLNVKWLCQKHHGEQHRKYVY